MFKQTLLSYLLDFCYPEKGARAEIDKYPHVDALRSAVVDLLKCHIGRQPLSAASISELERARNAKSELKRTFSPTRASAIVDYKRSPEGAANEIASGVIQYFKSDGDFGGALCDHCAKIFAFVKTNQRFCSRQCNWDYNNARKMETYKKERLAKMARAYREYKKGAR